MRAVVQRVAAAQVTVDDELVSSIGPGLCVLLGVTHSDGSDEAAKMGAKLAKMRIFPDEQGRMNLSVVDVGGEMLVVSQFTVYGDTAKGNRPGFTEAARPEHAEPLITEVVEHLQSYAIPVSTGRFRTHMQVSLTNNGPTTLVVDVG